MAQKLDVGFLQELESEEYAPITRKAERSMIREYQENGDPGVLQLLIKHNLRFIVDFVVKKGDIEMDLVQAAVLGFRRALEKFDLGKRKSIHFKSRDGDYKLTTYARDWIRFEMQNYKRKLHVVSPSHYAVYNSKTVENIMNATRAGDDVCPSKLSDRRIATALKAAKDVAPIGHGHDDLYASDCASPYDEAVHNEEAEILADQIAMVRGVLPLIPSDEASVLGKRFLGGEHVVSYRHLCEEMGCSHETVRKIEKRGMERVKSILW